MKREQVIELVEDIRSKGMSKARIDHLRHELRDASHARSSLANDFNRALAYCFILISGARWIPKEQRRYLRPNRRAVFMALCMLASVILQVFVLGLLFVAIGLGDYAIILIIFTLLFELGYVASKSQKMIKAGICNDDGVSVSCSDCQYDLSGHESVLGDEFWIGPETCPECGKTYPSIV